MAHPVWNDVIVHAWLRLGSVALIAGVVALVLEFMGLAKPDDELPPLTQIVVAHVPWWITMAICGALMAFAMWLVYHFWISYEYAAR